MSDFVTPDDLKRERLQQIAAMPNGSDKVNAIVQFGKWSPSMSDMAGRNYPGFKSYLDDQGLLDAKYRMPDGSAWEQKMLGRQDALNANSQNELAARNNSAWAQMSDRLASTQGLSAGASERLAQQQGRTGMLAQQELSNQNNLARLNIGADSEKLGMDNQRWNMEQALRQRDTENAFNMDRYRTLMGASAAERTAQATENAGKK